MIRVNRTPNSHRRKPQPSQLHSHRHRHLFSRCDMNSGQQAARSALNRKAAALTVSVGFQTRTRADATREQRFAAAEAATVVAAE